MISLICAQVRDEYTSSKFLLALIVCRTDYDTKGVTDQSNYAVRDVCAGKDFRHTAHKKSLFCQRYPEILAMMYMCAWCPVTENLLINCTSYMSMRSDGCWHAQAERHHCKPCHTHPTVMTAIRPCLGVLHA